VLSLSYTKKPENWCAWGVRPHAHQFSDLFCATFQPVLDLLIEGLGLQVFVYDKDNPTPTA